MVHTKGCGRGGHPPKLSARFRSTHEIIAQRLNARYQQIQEVQLVEQDITSVVAIREP